MNEDCERKRSGGFELRSSHQVSLKKIGEFGGGGGKEKWKGKERKGW